MTQPNEQSKPAASAPAKNDDADATAKAKLDKEILEQGEKDRQAHREDGVFSREANPDFGGESFGYGKLPE